MKLIEFDGADFKVADEAFLIRPIRELFQRDKSKKKETFWKEISYLWFMCDPRSTLLYIVDESERDKELRLQEGFDSSWTPDAILKQAMEMYRQHTVTTSSLLLESMRKGIENVRNFLSAVDLFAVDKNDKPIYQVSTMTSALKQVPELARALSEAEKSLAKDFDTSDKARGTTEKAIGEDW